MIEECDMCGSKIKDGHCECGQWFSNQEMKDEPIKKAIEKFHTMNQMVLTGDAPHLGCACVFFRGDYNDCEKVKEFICKMKSRPNYKC